MADPHIYFFLIEICSKSENTVVGLSCQLFVFFRINVFDVKHDKIGKLHQFVQFFDELGIGGLVCDAGGIDTGMDAMLFTQSEQLQQEIYLHQWLATCDSESAAIYVEGLVTLILFDDLGCFHNGTAGHRPGVRIVAISTSHGAALDKYDKTCSGTVNRTKTFQRMNSSAHI